MGVLWAMAKKDLLLLSRDRANMFLTFAWPLLLATFFGSLAPGLFADGPKTIEVLVVDQDQSELSERFTSALHESDELDLVATDLDTAQRRVRKGDAAAYILLGKGFSSGAGPFSPTPTRVELGVDPRRGATGAMVEGAVLRHGHRVLREDLGDPTRAKAALHDAAESVRRANPDDAATPEALEQFGSDLEQFLHALPAGAGPPGEPLVVVKNKIKAPAAAQRPDNAYAITFPQGIIWAVLACSATFGIGMITERDSGTMLRLFVAPVTKAHILGGKAVACFIAITVVQIVLLSVGVTAFGVVPQSWPLLALALACTAIGFCGVMMLLTVLGRRSQSASGLSWAMLMVFAMLGGGMLPLVAMPPWLQSVSTASPVSWALLAIEGSLWRGYSLADMAVPCGALVAMGVVSFVWGAWRFSYD